MFRLNVIKFLNISYINRKLFLNETKFREKGEYHINSVFILVWIYFRKNYDNGKSIESYIFNVIYKYFNTKMCYENWDTLFDPYPASAEDFK